MIYKFYLKNNSCKENTPLREEKKISRKEGESPRKKEIPLRLNYFAPLREQKRRHFKASYPAVGRLSGFARKNPPRRTRNAAGQAAKKGRRQNQDSFAPLRESTFFKKSIGNTVEIAEFQPGQFQFLQFSINGLKPCGPGKQ